MKRQKTPHRSHSRIGHPFATVRQVEIGIHRRHRLFSTASGKIVPLDNVDSTPWMV